MGCRMRHGETTISKQLYDRAHQLVQRVHVPHQSAGTSEHRDSIDKSYHCRGDLAYLSGLL
jgi:hypothetical protein